jgi:hypothetical protein
MRFLRVPAIVLGLLALSKSAHADGPATLCGQDPANLTTTSSDLVRDMQIAISQGDIAGMQAAFAPFDAIAQKCDAGSDPNVAGPEFRTLCGFDCHVQLAQYHLFLAGDVAYFQAKATGDPNALSALLDPTDMATQVNDGLRIVTSGFALLGNTLPAGNNSLHGYLSNKGALNLLQAKLYMAQGDTYYQNVSDARLARLVYLVNTTLDRDPAAGASMTSLAQAAYDAALWGLNEALLEIPGASGDATYNSLALQANALVQELTQRRQSLAQGMMFIGIDPDAYTNINISDQRTHLTTLATNVTTIESNIENLVKTFEANKQAIETANAGNGFAAANQQLTVAAYNVAQVEALAAQQTNDLQTALHQVQGAQAGYQQQVATAQTLFALQKDIATSQNQLAQNKMTGELDILNYKNQVLQQQQNSLQWLMNTEVSQTNLQLQVDSMESQKLTLRTSLLKDAAIEAQLDARIQEAQNQIAISNNNIATDQANIADRQAAMTTIFDASNHAAAAAICADESQLTQLTGTPSTYSWTEQNGAVTHTCADIAANFVPANPNMPTQQAYIKARCDMQATAAAANINSSADLLICVVGTGNLSAAAQLSLAKYISNNPQLTDPTSTLANYDCSGVKAACAAQGAACTNLTTNAPLIAQQQKSAADKNVAAIQAHISALNDFRNWSDAQLVNAAAEKALQLTLWTAQATALTATEEGTAGAPLILAGAAGPFPIAGTEIDLYQASQAAYQTAATINSIAQQAEGVADFVFSAHATVKQLDMQMDALNAQYDQAVIAQTLQNYAAAQTIVEITGRALDLDRTIEGAIAQQDMNVLDCNNTADKLASQIAQVTFNRDQLISAAKAAAMQNSQIQTAIGNLNLSIQNEQTTISSANLNISDLNLEKLKTFDDSDSIQGNPCTLGPAQAPADFARSDGSGCIASPTVPSPVIGLMSRTIEQENTLQALIGTLNNQVNQNGQLTQAIATVNSQVFQTNINMNAAQTNYLQSYINGEQDYTTNLATTLGQLQNTITDANGIVAQMDGVAKAMNTEVVNEKQNMLDSSEQLYTQIAVNPGNQIYLSQQDMIASLTRGVPEFVQQKRRLMQEANYELALLYNKVNILQSSTQSAVPYSAPLSYVTTGDDLNTLLNEWDTTLFQQPADILAEVVSIDIPGDTGLGRKLASDLDAEFEISPIAANGQMGANGYFALWHDRFNQAEAFTVLDMNLLVDFVQGTSCQPQHFQLYHQGSGFKFFSPDGVSIEPTFSTGEARLADPMYFVRESDTDSFTTQWQNKVMNTWDFWSGKVSIAYDPNLELPLLGEPVIGTYRIQLDPAVAQNQSSTSAACSYDGALFRLYIAYSRVGN